MMLLVRFSAALLAILASWGVFALLFTGVGLSLRPGSRDGAGVVSLGDSFWVGWAVVVALLQVWHLLWPVNGWAFLFVALVSGAGLWRHRAAWRGLGSALKGIERARWLLIVLGLVWMAHHALGEPRVYDTGLYHAQAVRWIRSFAIVPGLGNVHGRLAFNNSSFLYAALLNVGPWTGHYFHFASSLLLAVLLVQLTVDIPPRRREGASRVESFFSALLLIGVVAAARDSGVSSPTPDLPVLALGIVISRILLRALSRAAAPTFGDVATVLLLSLIGVTVKLSFVVFGIGAPALLIWIWIRRERKVSLRRATILGLITIAILGAWAGRGLILSGYPAYPATFGGIPVRWKVPAEMARGDMRGIRDWARFYCFSPPHDDIRRWPEVCLRGCLANENVLIPLAMLVLAGVLRFLASLGGGGERSRPSGAGWLFAPPAAWIVFWVLTAPDPRFAAAAFWVVGGGALALALDATWPRSPDRARMWRRGFQAIAVLGCLWLIGYGVIAGKGAFRARWRATGSLSSALGELSLNESFLNGHAFYQGFQPMPTAPLTLYRTRSGLQVHTPVEDDRCWEAPLPCTPYRRDDLRLRGESMQEGFVTERRPAAGGGG